MIANKTDAILKCSPRINNTIDMPRIELGNMTVPTSTVAKNIGVFFDDALTMKNHVQHMCVWHISSLIASAKSDTFSIEKPRK